MSKILDESFVTLATNDNYVLGALNLAYSLKSSNTNRMLTILITNHVSSFLQNLLREVFDRVEIVSIMDSNDSLNLNLLKRPELGVTFTKLHCWRLIQYKKCVFLDADCLALKNVDDLFNREEFSAAPDVGWPDCFNSGVFVFKPSEETYSRILQFAIENGSFDGGDQGLLNSFFNNWSISESSKRLPFIYNMTTNVSYSYAPAYKQFSDSIKIVHFIGAQKPWCYSYNLQTNTVVGNVNLNESNHLNKWWSLFVQFVLPKLDDNTKNRISIQLIKNQETFQNSNIKHQFYQTNETGQSQGSQTQYYSENIVSSGVVIGSDQHQNLWERGQIEYTGRDSFSNIQAHLDAQLHKNN